VRGDLRIDREAKLLAINVVGGGGCLLDEPLRDELAVVPAAVAGHAIKKL
jgi:hypothetical protein